MFLETSAHSRQCYRTLCLLLINDRRIIALDMDGKEMWVSDQYDGVNALSPVLSADGSYVFFNRNSGVDEDLTGHFTVLSNDGSLFFTRENNDTAPFGAIGIFHEPIEGLYDSYLSPEGLLFEGAENTNDILVWSVAPKPTDRVLGEGQLYGFQFPKTFDGDSAGLTFFPLGGTRTFQTDTAPVFTLGGRTMYMGISQSGFRGWIGDPDVLGLTRDYFSDSPKARAGFERNSRNAAQSVWASPALSSDPFEPYIFGGSAAEEFCWMDFDMSNSDCVDTETLVKTQAKVTADDDYAIYIETGEFIGGVLGNEVTAAKLHMARISEGRQGITIFDVLEFPVQGALVEGEFDLMGDDSLVFLATTNGQLFCLQIGNIPETPAPSDSPSASPTVSPAPSVSPTAAPLAPTLPPTPAPTPNTPKPTPENIVETTEPPTPDLIIIGPPVGEDDGADGFSRKIGVTLSGVAAVVAMLVA
jgi:hypothetical protein